MNGTKSWSWCAGGEAVEPVRYYQALTVSGAAPENGRYPISRAPRGQEQFPYQRLCFWKASEVIESMGKGVRK